MNTIPQAPTIKSLILSCITALLLALIIFLVAVLPAEFNIDPTGLGEAMGLTVLAQSSAATGKARVISCPVDKHADAKEWLDTVIITIPAKKGLEYKFHINKGEMLEFDWKTDGKLLHFDFHGEPEGDTSGYFKSFKESTQSQSSGSLITPFTGSHGWYWENKSNQAVSIILKTQGKYKIMGLR